MSSLEATMARTSGGRAKEGALQRLAAAAVASLAAGATGLLLVFGQGLFELPGLIPAGLAYALLPGIPALLAGRHRLGGRRGPTGYVVLGALAAVLWFVPFMGVFAPSDPALVAAAIASMSVYHALSGAAGGLAFWLLAGRGAPLGETRGSILPPT